ncbi:hypothetical protein D3C59_36425 [Streptomyces sp. SHP22-7]|nr:hypothetical protein D3C59_36425 [Streptomyces sp. SHP22-7]
MGSQVALRRQISVRSIVWAASRVNVQLVERPSGVVQRRLVQRARWAAVSHMRPQYPQRGRILADLGGVAEAYGVLEALLLETRSRYACWASSASPVAFSDQS